MTGSKGCAATGERERERGRSGRDGRALKERKRGLDDDDDSGVNTARSSGQSATKAPEEKSHLSLLRLFSRPLVPLFRREHTAFSIGTNARLTTVESHADAHMNARARVWVHRIRGSGGGGVGVRIGRKEVGDGTRDTSLGREREGQREWGTHDKQKSKREHKRCGRSKHRLLIVPFASALIWHCVLCRAPTANSIDREREHRQLAAIVSIRVNMTSFDQQFHCPTEKSVVDFIDPFHALMHLQYRKVAKPYLINVDIHHKSIHTVSDQDEENTHPAQGVAARSQKRRAFIFCRLVMFRSNGDITMEWEPIANRSTPRCLTFVNSRSAGVGKKGNENKTKERREIDA
ncbi:hypothetical protein G5I_02898 [Acromyrmex echinatior]|uniref:Uncharacterized protein n=1 Tax=Acromyrmex echinatior TaxID=103372 RepID=F4WBI6_ACREC|nr:hypothetical protein G5I_02898 [Acromyrmex echinatior]